MVEDSVLIPLESYSQFEVNCMTKFRNIKNILETCWYLDADRDDGVCGGVNIEGGDLVIVAVPKHYERAIVLVRFVPAVDYLVTSSIHAEKEMLCIRSSLFKFAFLGKFLAYNRIQG